MYKSHLKKNSFQPIEEVETELSINEFESYKKENSPYLIEHFNR